MRCGLHRCRLHGSHAQATGEACEGQCMTAAIDPDLFVLSARLRRAQPRNASVLELCARAGKLAYERRHRRTRLTSRAWLVVLVRVVSDCPRGIPRDRVHRPHRTSDSSPTIIGHFSRVTGVVGAKTSANAIMTDLPPIHCIPPTCMNKPPSGNPKSKAQLNQGRAQLNAEHQADRTPAARGPTTNGGGITAQSSARANEAECPDRC